MKKLILLFITSLFFSLLILQINLSREFELLHGNLPQNNADYVLTFEDEIPPSCNLLDNLDYSNRSNYDIALTIPDSRKWYLNVINAELQDNNRIPEQFKEQQYSYFTFKDISSGESCVVDALVRISGDVNDHIDFETFVTSLDIELLNENIFGYTDFKLFLPKSRYLDNEIFITSFLKQMGYLAPTSFYIDVNVNGTKTKFIFQEKINKILVESNNFKEGPILEAFENIAWGETGWFTSDTILPPKINNKIWLRKSEDNLELAKHSIEKVFKLLIYGVDNSNYDYLMCENCLLNYDTLEIENANYLKEFQLIMTVLRAHRGINFSDRKYYIDPLTEFLYPVYYDGTAELLIYNYQTQKWDLTKDELGLKAHLDKVPIVNLSQENINNLIDKINNFNYQQFSDNLSLNGIQPESLGFKSEEFINFLYKNIDNYEDNTHADLNSNLKSYFSSNSVRSEQYLLLLEDEEGYKVCEVDLYNCNNFVVSNEELVEILSGSFLYNEKLIFYIGNFDTLFKETTPKLNNYKTSKTDSLGYSFQFIGNADISYFDKTLIINNPSIDFRILINSQTLIDEKIIFTSNNDNSQYSKTFLTGCVTIYNSKIFNLEFESKKSSCEDSLNIISSKGVLKKVNINNSKFDGLDIDFSDIEIETLNVNNIGNDCSDFSYGSYKILEANLSSCGDKGMSVGEKSKIYVEKLVTESSNIGVAVKDSSRADINFFKSTNDSFCISSYRKKQEFSSAKIYISQIVCGSNNIYKQKPSD